MHLVSMRVCRGEGVDLLVGQVELVELDSRSLHLQSCLQQLLLAVFDLETGDALDLQKLAAGSESVLREPQAADGGEQPGLQDVQLMGVKHHDLLACHDAVARRDRELLDARLDEGAYRVRRSG